MAPAARPPSVTERLRAPSYLALREDVSGIELNKLAEAAAETLRLTEDAYRDVLGYVLKKVEPTLRPLPSGNARRHDLQAATQVPWMSGLFRREDLLPTVIRWLGEWGFHPAAEGRLRLDDEERPGRPRAPSAPRCACPTRCAWSSSGARAWTPWAASCTSTATPCTTPTCPSNSRWSCAGWRTPR